MERSISWEPPEYQSYFFCLVVGDAFENKVFVTSAKLTRTPFAPIPTDGAPLARRQAAGVYTGNTGKALTAKKLVVWGGQLNASTTTNTGGIYDVAGNTWSDLPSAGAPAAGTFQVDTPGIFTGSTGDLDTEDRVIYYGAISSTSGGIYNLSSEAWEPIAAGPTGVTSNYVWTGSTGDVDTAFRMIGWVDGTNIPKIYDIKTNTWTNGNNSGAPPSKRYSSAIWTGNTGDVATSHKMIVWSGWPVDSTAGGIYDPKADSWSLTDTTSTEIPQARRWHSAVWIGNTGNPATSFKMMVFGGLSAAGSALQDGGLYDPKTNSWQKIPSEPGTGMQDIGTYWAGGELVWVLTWETVRSFNLATGVWKSYGNNPEGSRIRYGVGAIDPGNDFILMWSGEGYLNVGSIFLIPGL